MGILEDINELEPCGVDFKYDDEYIAIELEVEKNFNVSNIGKSQWDIVILKCENVLCNDSKDLKILSYWLYAKWQFNGWAAFLQNFDTYTKVLDRYRKELYPKVEKRKIKIFEWIENVLEEELINAITSFSKIELDTLYESLERLDTIIPFIIESNFNLFKNLRLQCSQHIQNIKIKEEEQAQQLELEEQEALKKRIEQEKLNKVDQLRRNEEAEILEKFVSNKVQVTGNELKCLITDDINKCCEIMNTLSKELLEKSPGDYRGYKILFSIAEILLDQVYNNANIVVDNLIPSNDIIKTTRSLGDEKVSIQQLEALNEQLLLRPTWIEGYFIVSKILYKLSKADDANQIENMIFYFLSKEETILGINCRDEKLIPEDMILWKQTKEFSLNSNDNNAIEYQHTYQEVLKIKKEENSNNAFMLLESHYQKAQGEESRFRWRVLMVDFALEIGDKKLALSLLYELERLIKKYQIDLWQPSLAIGVYEMLLKPIFTQELSVEDKERIYSKLSILDIQKVIKL